MPEFDAFVSTAETGTPDQVFAALEGMAQAEVGAVMFSCSTFDLTAGQWHRICTAMTDAYPVSGLKLIVPNAPTGQVLDNRTTLVANTLAKIKAVVPDHALTRCRPRPAKVDGQPERPCSATGDDASTRPPTLPDPGPDGWVWPCPAYE